MNLAAIDLNLLVALDALLSEQNVTRAAERVGVSQSAMSKELARLRELFNDPLLVRSGSAMVLTSKAELVRAPLQQALAQIRHTLTTSPDFDPATCTGTFNIASIPSVLAALLPVLLQELASVAPSVCVNTVVPPPRKEALASLESGAIDLLLSYLNEPPQSIRSELLLEDEAVLVARRDHPRIQGSITLEELRRESLVLVTPQMLFEQRFNVRGLIDQPDKGPHQVLTVPSPLLAWIVVSRTDCVCFATESLVREHTRSFGLQAVPSPLGLPDATMEMYWHVRTDRDPAHRWFRDLVGQILR